MEGLKEFIETEVHVIFSKAIKRYAKEFREDEANAGLLLSLDSNNEVVYKVCIGGSPTKVVTIKDILNVKFIDLKGYSQIVPPHIKRLLMEFEQAYSGSAEVIVVLNPDNDDLIRLFLYVNQKQQKEVFVNEMIGPIKLST